MTIRLLFLFRRNRAKQLQDWRNGDGPLDFLHGFPFIDLDRFTCDLAEGDDRSNDWRRRVCYPMEYLISRTVEVGFSIHIVWIHWNKIKQADVLVSTVDTCGLPIAMLKWLGVLRVPVIYISQGLAHRLLSRTATVSGRVLRSLYSRFLQSVERVLVFGEGATAPVVRALGVEMERVFVLQVAVDVSFWAPAENHVQRDYILSVGTDAARDYSTLLGAVGNHNLHIITRQRVSNSVLGSAVRVSSDHSFAQLRDLYRAARFVVIPLQDVDQPSGQSASLQAMACAKAVILTRTQGLWDPECMRHMDTCYLVEPRDVDNLKEAINFLYTNPQEAERIGLNARRLVERRYTAHSLAHNLQRHVLEVVA